MEHSRARIILDGAIAGLIGAAAVAIWFLIFDAARGAPLQTPSLLAASLLHGARNVVPTGSLLQLTAEYSVLHVSAFVIVGVAGALLLEAAETEPTLTFSLVIFFAAFEVFFFAVVIFMGPVAMAALTWWGILVGNLLATAAMLAFFLGRHPMLGRDLFGEWLLVASEGMTAGVLGALLVALWFLAYDFASGEPFRTPAMLGAAIFTVVKDPNLVKVTMPLVLGYTVLHFFAFAIFGLAAAVLITASEREPLFALGVFVLFAIFEVFFVGFVTLVDASLLQVVGWWKIVVGNILALTGMAAFFLMRHRDLGVRLTQRWAALEMEGDEAEPSGHRHHPAGHRDS